MTTEVALGPSSRSSGDLQDACDELWEDLKGDKKAQATLAMKLEVAPDRLEINGPSPAKFEDEAAGIDLVTGGVALILMRYYVAPLAKDISLDIWRHFFLPRLKTRFGDDAVGDEQQVKKNDE